MQRILSRPVDIAILVYFRFFTGILLAQELINALVIGKFSEYTSPRFHFSYMFFDWVRPWPSKWGMGMHFAVTIVAGFFVALGIHHRLSTMVLFLGYASLFLMEMSQFINHIYLYSLLSFWMIWMPLDQKNLPPKAPSWMLYLILFHMSIAYFFAGVAKLNLDWLQGTPMDIFLAKHRVPFSPIFFAWGGMFFDLFIVPALIWKKTRGIALAIASVFHISNALIFGLATFPWFSLMVTTMFFNPSWPRKIPLFKNFLISTKNEHYPQLKFGMTSALGIYVVIHLLVPLRHHLYPGNTSWTEEGHMFAWRMMLRDKQGDIAFWVKDKKLGKTRKIDPYHYLTERQVSGMVGKPEMILQFSHFLRDEFQDVEVYASSRVGLNGRPLQEMILQGTDLAREERGFGHFSWIQELRSDSLVKEQNELSSLPLLRH